MNSFPITLRSPLSADECLARLRPAMDHESPGEMTLKEVLRGSCDVIGHIDGNRIELRRRIPYSSLFQPVFTATLSEDDGGTIIEGEMAIGDPGHSFARWAGIIASLVGGVVFIGALVKFSLGDALPSTWIGLAFPAGLALVVGSSRFATRRRLRHDADFLTRHLIRILDARSSHETLRTSV